MKSLEDLPLFNDGGSIVLTGCVAGSKGVVGLSVYGATKAAVNERCTTNSS
jgi:NADP-dependent 3-hydroxy acid dehydrogenase YdfG